MSWPKVSAMSWQRSVSDVLAVCLPACRLVACISCNVVSNRAGRDARHHVEFLVARERRSSRLGDGLSQATLSRLNRSL